MRRGTRRTPQPAKRLVFDPDPTPAHHAPSGIDPGDRTAMRGKEGKKRIRAGTAREKRKGALLTLRSALRASPARAFRARTKPPRAEPSRFAMREPDPTERTGAPFR